MIGGFIMCGIERELVFENYACAMATINICEDTESIFGEHRRSGDNLTFTNNCGSSHATEQLVDANKNNICVI